MIRSETCLHCNKSIHARGLCRTHYLNWWVDNKDKTRHRAPRVLKDLSGLRFGKLTILRDSKLTTKRGCRLFSCVCECGTYCTARHCDLRSGHKASCGCLSGEQHGLSKTPEYFAWKAMRERCSNTKHPEYFRYGGRGIAVCARWNKSFMSFFSDLGSRPSAQHSLDRIDVNGNYESTNCRWATSHTQSKNRRRFVIPAAELSTLLSTLEAYKHRFGVLV